MKISKDKQSQEIKFNQKELDEIRDEAIWIVYEKKCIYTNLPIIRNELTNDLTIDHLIPGKTPILDGKKVDMEFLKEYFQLPQGFDLEGLENLAPCKQNPNNKKRTYILERTEKDLRIAREKKPIIEKEIEKLKAKKAMKLWTSMAKTYTSNDVEKLLSLEEAHNLLLDENPEFGNGKRIYIGKTGYPAANDIKQSCCISFKFLKLRGLLLTLTHSEILKHLAFATKTDPTLLFRRFITGPVSDEDLKNKDLKSKHYFIQLGNANFLLPIEELQELCDEVDFFVEKYLNALEATEKKLGITNFFPSKGFEHYFQLLRVSKFFCNKILAFADEFDFQKGKSKWHIFNRTGNRIEVLTTNKTNLYDACTHAVLYIEPDESNAVILWRNDPYNNHNDEHDNMFLERGRWNAEMTFRWLVKELIPEIAWHFEEIYDNKEGNWLDLWDRLMENFSGSKEESRLDLWKQFMQKFKKDYWPISKKISFEKFYKNFNINNYAFIIDYPLDKTETVEDLRHVIHSLRDIFDNSLHNQTHLFWITNNHRASIYKSIILILKNIPSIKKSELGYIIDKLRLSSASTATLEEISIEITSRINALKSSDFKEKHTIDDSFRCIAYLLNFSPHLNKDEVLKIQEYLSCFIEYCKKDRLIKKYACE